MEKYESQMSHYQSFHFQEVTVAPASAGNVAAAEVDDGTLPFFYQLEQWNDVNYRNH